MIKSLSTYLVLLLLIFQADIASGKISKRNPGAFLETHILNDKALQGERVIYEVRLLSPNPDIAGFEIKESPSFDNLPAGRVSPDTRLNPVVIDDVNYYSVVIDRYFVGAENTGKHRFQGGEYNIGFNRAVRIEDPFWGPSIMNKVDVISFKAPDVSLKVSPLPSKGRPEDFSGAIGNFEINVSLPQNEIREGEENIFIVSISGTGDLTDIPAPDIRQAFREGLRFKSMTDNKQNYVTKGRLGSEMELECVFSADKAGEYEILPISFSYYDSAAGEYRTITTEKITVSVLPSGSHKNDSPPVYMEI
ncbi:MAG: BatD family protein [Muribaculaceae bacterium]|nr:BatD family protein [Muribaculaceae bacterium]